MKGLIKSIIILLLIVKIVKGKKRLPTFEPTQGKNKIYSMNKIHYY